MLDDLHDCYRALDLEPEATLEEVKRSYRELVKVWHPDRFAGDPKLQRKAEEKLKQINFAYEWISKGEAAAPRRRTRSARPSSSGTGQQAKPPGSQAGPKEEKAREQSPPPKTEPSSHKTDRAETASQQGKEPKWAHAAIGFGFLALSLWLMPTLWDDFSKYEAGEGQRAPTKPATAANISSTPADAATIGNSFPPVEWLRTNDLAISPIGLAPQPGTTLTHATGTVVNLSTRKRFGVVVELQLLDADGKSLRQIRDYRAVLEPSASWDFRALVLDPNSKSARVLEVREDR